MHSAVTKFLRFLTPWYSEAEVEHREETTEVVRQRSIRARIKAENVIASYREADERLGRMSGR